MALDERDYMRERARAQFNAWCSDERPIRGHLEDIELLTAVQQNTLYSRPSTRRPRSANRARTTAVVVLAIGALAVAAAYRVAQQPPVHPARATAPRAVPRATQPRVQMPKTYVAAPWQEGDETGRLLISVDPLASGVRAVLVRDGVEWEAFARAGEAASIDLLPGTYIVRLFEYKNGRPLMNQEGLQAGVTIRYPGDTVSFAVSPSP